MISCIAAFQVHSGSGGIVGYFPDSSLYSTAIQQSEDATSETVLSIWSPDRGVLLQRREYDFKVTAALSSDGRYLAWGSGSLRGQLRLIHCSGREPDRNFLVSDVVDDDVSVDDITFIPGTNDLMFICDDRWWRWNITTDWPGVQLDNRINCLLAVSPDGLRMALVPAGVQSLEIEYWIVKSGEAGPISRVAPPETGGRKAVWHPNQPILATCGYWGEGIEVWDFSCSPSPIRVFHQPGGYTHMAFLPDGRLVTCHESGEIAIWSVNSSKKLASASTLGVQEYQLLQGSDQIIITDVSSSVVHISVAPNGRNIAAMTTSGTVVFFEIN